MCPDISPGPGLQARRQSSPEISCEVTVSTASVLIASRADPYRILVAVSQKHPHPVIPGGKVELADLARDAGVPGLSCVLRETLEEIGTCLMSARFIGMARDPDRDIRVVPVQKLMGALVSPPLAGDISPASMIKAHYGCPDYIFTGWVEESCIRATEELKRLRFVDVRSLAPGDLSAGHDVIAYAYLKMLDEKQTALSADALSDFGRMREEWARR